MAKGKKKPAFKAPVVKKAEPSPKKTEAKIEKGKKKESKHEFPTEGKCKHTKTKRAIGRNSRAITVCVDCGTITKFGAR